MKPNKPRLIVILGPTAIGKSRIAIELAKRINGEIINADSLQVYRYMDIGTAKPSREEQRGVKHHLIDIINPDNEFNAGLFRKYAIKAIDEISKRSSKIIIVGGTYLYVRVLIHGLLEGVESDRDIRKAIRDLRSSFGISFLYEKLSSLDPDAATRIHPNDYVRIERALEAYYLTGEKISELQEKHGFRGDEYEVLKIGLLEEREILRTKIDERVDRMLGQGLVDEVKKLREMGVRRDLKPMQSIGYKQINEYLDGEITHDRAVELIRRDTKRFAKRQMTWLRSDKEIRWYKQPVNSDDIVNEVVNFYN